MGANPAGQSIDPCFSRYCPREKTGRIFRRFPGPAGVPFGFLALLSVMPASYGTAIAGTMTTLWHPTFRLGATVAASLINPAHAEKAV
jgi:hypothetical protein